MNINTPTTLTHLLRSSGLISCTVLLIGTALTAHASSQQTDEALLVRGKALATAADCIACHTSDPSRPFAGGRAITSPLGDIFAPNITPSKTAGIGNYSEAQFSDALRKGVNAKGEYLYPSMPYTAYSGITDDDMQALYTYFISTVVPDDRQSPKTTLPFPYNIRMSMVVWNTLFLKQTPYINDQTLNPELNRGKYLVDTLGHCSACHSPRNVMMAEQPEAYLAGAHVNGWLAPNITSDPISGIGQWTIEEIATYLKTGHVEGKAQAGGGMAEAVEHSLRFMPDSDLQAIAHYLKSVPPRRYNNDTKAAFEYTGGTDVPSLTEFEPQRGDSSIDPDSVTDSSTVNGSLLYSGACASCHQPHGRGTEGQYFPSLSHNQAVGLISPDNLIMAILHGIDRQGADRHALMPAFDKDLNNAQVAAVVNYVNQHFGNPRAITSETQVAEVRAGGPKPLLLKITNFALAAGTLSIILLLVLLGRRILLKFTM